jgi:hypothetical protein
VTVTVDVATPSADTEVGEAATVEVATDATGVVKVTDGVCPDPFKVTESVVSVAVKVTVSAVVSVTATVATPELLVTAGEVVNAA